MNSMIQAILRLPGLGQRSVLRVFLSNSIIELGMTLEFAQAGLLAVLDVQLPDFPSFVS